MNGNIVKIDRDTYEEKAKDGVFVLFDAGDYRALDAMKGSERTFFLVDIPKTTFYEMNLEACYDLLTLHHYGEKGQVESKIGEYMLQTV